VAAHLLEEAEEEVDHGPVELGHPRRDHLQAIGRIVGHQHAIVTGNVTDVRRRQRQRRDDEEGGEVLDAVGDERVLELSEPHLEAAAEVVRVIRRDRIVHL
jgi:hypothetical protein